MFYIFVAITAYFLVALQTILDKFMLTTNRVSEPATYTFYVGLMSLFTFALFPFGFHLIGFGQLVWSILSGIMFIYGIFCLFTAIEKNEASRVTPIVTAIIPITTVITSTLFLGEVFSMRVILGVALLIFGGLFLSLQFFSGSFESRKMFKGFHLTVLAGVLIAVAFSIFKYLYEQDNFFNVFIWTRLGLTVGALSLLLFPVWRKDIFKSFQNSNYLKRENRRTGVLFVANKILGGIGSALTHFAVSLGSVAVVNAMASLEAVFVFVVGITLSAKFPAIFQEKRTLKNVLHKTLAICIIVAGIALISIK